VQFTFLGFTFRPRGAKNKQGRLFTSFLPAVSDTALKRMRETVRGWKLHRQTPKTLQELAWQYNSTIRGWVNYYGTFYRTAMHKLFQYLDRRLLQWARRKYKTLRRHQRLSADWLGKMKMDFPALFVHWRSMEGRVG
jgi:RNA-directed DNA polymerase